MDKDLWTKNEKYMHDFLPNILSGAKVKSGRNFSLLLTSFSWPYPGIAAINQRKFLYTIADLIGAIYTHAYMHLSLIHI